MPYLAWSRPDWPLDQACSLYPMSGSLNAYSSIGQCDELKGSPGESQKESQKNWAMVKEPAIRARPAPDLRLGARLGPHLGLRPDPRMPRE